MATKGASRLSQTYEQQVRACVTKMLLAKVMKEKYASLLSAMNRLRQEVRHHCCASSSATHEDCLYLAIRCALAPEGDPEASRCILQDMMAEFEPRDIAPSFQPPQVMHISGILELQ